MANAGYIIVKSGNNDGDKPKPRGVEAFYGPLDKGSAKPSFCYPKQRQALKSDIDSIEKALKDGYVAPTRIIKTKIDLQSKKKRLDEIDQQEHEAKKLFKANMDSCMKRRDELAGIIAEAMPSVKDVDKKRVNSQRVYDIEKKGLKGARPLGELKREYQILSCLAEEESNTKFLQKD